MLQIGQIYLSKYTIKYKYMYIYMRVIYILLQIIDIIILLYMKENHLEIFEKIKFRNFTTNNIDIL